MLKFLTHKLRTHSLNEDNVSEKVGVAASRLREAKVTRHQKMAAARTKKRNDRRLRARGSARRVSRALAAGPRPAAAPRARRPGRRSGVAEVVGSALQTPQ